MLPALPVSSEKSCSAAKTDNAETPSDVGLTKAAGKRLICKN
jgi:hypothetical protein